MDALCQLSVVWVGVLVAVFLAKRTRLTPVLFYLAVGAVSSTQVCCRRSPTPSFADSQKSASC